MGELGFGEREPPLAVSSPLSSCHASALPSSPPAPVQPPQPPPLLLLLLPPLLSPTERGGGDSGSHPQRAGGWGGFGEHPWPRGLCAVPPPPGWEERRGKGGDAVKGGGLLAQGGVTQLGVPPPHTARGTQKSWCGEGGAQGHKGAGRGDGNWVRGLCACCGVQEKCRGVQTHHGVQEMRLGVQARGAPICNRSWVPAPACNRSRPPTSCARTGCHAPLGEELGGGDTPNPGASESSTRRSLTTAFLSPSMAPLVPPWGPRVFLTPTLAPAPVAVNEALSSGRAAGPGHPSGGRERGGGG